MNKSDYKHWKTYFSTKIIEHGENLHGIGGWDEITHIKYWEFISTIIGHVTNKKILDVGGGNAIYNELTKSNLVINVDISEEQLRHSIKHNMLPVAGNAITLPFKNQSFDYVLCIGVFQYIMCDDRKKLIDELYRICKLGGLIFLETPNKAALVRKLLKIKHMIRSPLSLIFRHSNKNNYNYISLQEFVNFIKLDNLYEIFALFLIHRPLKVVTFATMPDSANSHIENWLTTDFVFVIRRRDNFKVIL